MDKENQLKKCELCKEIATSLCFICNSYFCNQCYKYVHDKKININHKKEIIDPFVPIDLKCPEHPQHPIYLFCTDEKGKHNFIYFNSTLLYMLPF